MIRAGKQNASDSPLSLQTSTSDDGTLTLTFEGRLDSTSTATVWETVMQAMEEKNFSRVTIDASKLEYCDGSGISLLHEIDTLGRKKTDQVSIVDLKKEFQQILDLHDVEDARRLEGKGQQHSNPVNEIGEKTIDALNEAIALISFVGELFVATLVAFTHPRKIRWKDAFWVAETAGANALPLVTLISFLVGLIMAFQAAIPMRMFGAEIFVANLIALSMMRELGPLMTAIVIGGRSGSAFAAELGTMRINEEIDALTTMGLDPVRFLVVTRVIATVLMTPLLTIYANVMGILGGAAVLVSFGFTLNTYVNQVMASVTYIDFLGGIFKAFVFGLLIAAVGCLRGLQTKTGPSAVGESTTSAVVSSIILIVVVDGIFSVVYFYLGI
jgi:phospholipid/cholesterol/gamma-HCH transport system permease protein